MKARFRGSLWDYDDGGWHFVSVPLAISEDLRERAGERLRGFGSVRVRVTIGQTSWDTSVFPSKEGHYLLPVKKPVRRAEDLAAGDVVDVAIEVIEDAAPARRSGPSRDPA